MFVNPYASFLAGRDPIAQIHTTPATLEAVLRQIGSVGLARSYGEGKWNASQILCHLADVEVAWAFRLRQAIAEPHHVIQPFAQDDWARAYPQMDAKLAEQAFLALRNWNLAFLATVTEAEHGKVVTHPERGTTTFLGLLKTMAGHDLNHLAQLEAIATAPATSRNASD